MKKGTITSGAHPYYGRYNSRGKRANSKLLKGIKVGNVQRAFRKLDKEKAKGKK